MACSACKRAVAFRQQLADARASGEEPVAPAFLVEASSNRIMLKDGTTSYLNKALIRITKRPSGGWGVRFSINGVDKVFDGRTPEEVFRNVAEHLSLNRLSYTSHSLWLNLNLQWYSRTSPQHHLAVHGALSELIKESDQKLARAVQAGAPPDEWLPDALTAVGHYLSSPHVYTATGFTSRLGDITEMLNPAVSSRMGNTVLYAEAVKFLSGVRSAPPTSLNSARAWFTGYFKSLLKLVDFQPAVVDDLLSKFNWP